MDNIKSTLISLNSPGSWKKALEGIPHAFGHTWENCFAMNFTTNYPTFLYSFQDFDTRIICPIAERSYHGYTDILTPYGFSGFSGNNFSDKLETHWRNMAAANSYVCGYIALNPLFNEFNYFNFQENGASIYAIDLRLSEMQLFANLSTNRKRELRSAQRDSLKVISDKASLKDFFITNYPVFFSQREHSKTYDLSLKTLTLLVDSPNVFLNGVVVNDELKAVSMYGFTPFCGDYLFTVSLEKNYTTYLIWNAMSYLKSLDIPYINLGGGVRGFDNIAEFKKRFGGTELKINSLKQIYNQQVYNQLMENVDKDAISSGFFPGYRASEFR